MRQRAPPLPSHMPRVPFTFPTPIHVLTPIYPYPTTAKFCVFQSNDRMVRRKKDAAAIPDPSKKRSPNRMVVDEATSDDNSVVALSTAKVSSRRSRSSHIVERPQCLERTSHPGRGPLSCCLPSACRSSRLRSRSAFPCLLFSLALTPSEPANPPSPRHNWISDVEACRSAQCRTVPQTALVPAFVRRPLDPSSPSFVLPACPASLRPAWLPAAPRVPDGGAAAFPGRHGPDQGKEEQGHGLHRAGGRHRGRLEHPHEQGRLRRGGHGVSLFDVAVSCSVG